MDYSGTIAGGNYRIIRKLSEGFLSSLYLARDLRDSDVTIAVKILDRSRISTRVEDMIRFRTDIAAIMHIRHPNLVTVHEVNDIDTPYRYPVPYIVMDLVDGKSLESIINEDVDMPLQKKIELIAQISSALQHVHRQGILHRDIRPGNIIMTQQGAVLTDAGIARIMDFGEYHKHGELLRLFYYMPPEQSGTIGHAVDERSDLYSLGIVMYRLLSGALPFTGDTIRALAHSHLTHIPARLTSLAPGVPAICDDIVMKLLEKEPGKRYQSAQGLSADLEKFLKGERAFIPGLNDTTVRLSYKTRFTGRGNELQKLMTLHHDSAKGKGSFCMVTGDTGAGKTRLLREFSSALASESHPCIALFDSPGDINTPYRAMSTILDKYIQLFSMYPEKTKGRISACFRGSSEAPASMLLQINPRVKIVLDEPEQPEALTEGKEAGPVFKAAGDFLRVCAEAGGSLTLIVDDIHRMDGVSMEILLELSSGISNSPLCVVASYPAEDVNRYPYLAEFIRHHQEHGPSYHTLTLGPLTPGETKDIVESVLFDSTGATEEISSIIHARSGGNPSFAIQILKQLIDERAVTSAETGWILQRKKLESAEIPDTMADIIVKKIPLLNALEQSVLSYGAVIGMKFSSPLLLALLKKTSPAAGVPDHEIVLIVNKAMTMGFLGTAGSLPEDFHFVHARVHDAFYGCIGHETRRAIHGEIAAILENLYADDIDAHLYELAYHSIASDDSGKILQYAYPAALKLKNEYALEQAIDCLSKVTEVCRKTDDKPDDVDTDLLLRFAGEELAFLYIITGEYDKAIRIYTSLIENTTDTYEKASLYRNISRAHFKKGDWSACEKTGAIGLGLLGFTLPTKKLSLWAGIFTEFLLHILPGKIKKEFITHDENMKRVYRHISWSYLDLGWSYILSDNFKFLMVALKVLNIAEYRLGQSRVLGMALGGYGALLMSVHRFEASIRYQKRSLKIRKEQGDEWGYAQSLQWLGYCYEWKGDYRQSILCFNESLAIFNKIGDQREAGMCISGLIHNYMFMSEYSKVAAFLDEYRDVTSAAKDHYGISELHTYMTRHLAEQGNLESAIEEGGKAFAYSRDQNIAFTHCRACHELGMVYLEKNEPLRALEYLSAAKSMIEQHRFLKHYTVSTYTLYAECLIHLYTRSLGASPDDTALHPGLSDIRNACKKALSHTRRWVSHYSAALRVCAQYHDLCNDGKKTAKLFMQAIEQAGKLGQLYEEAKCRYLFARHLIRQEKNDLARFHLETAYTIFSRIGASLYVTRIAELLGMKGSESPSPASILNEEKLAAVMKLSTELAVMTDIKTIISRAVHSAVEYTGAVRCCVLTADGDAPDLRHSASYNMDFSDISEHIHCILHYVFHNDLPLIVDDAAYNTGLQAILSGPSALNGSLLCMTIKMKEKTIGVLYMDNPFLASVFNVNDVSILNLIFSYIPFIPDIRPETARPVLPREEAGKKTTIPDLTGKKIESVITYLQENYRRDISREGLAEHLEINPDYLGKMFRIYTGKKIGEYINELRIHEAARALRETDNSIIDIAFSVGYESLRTFNRLFLKVMGAAPTQYRDSFKQ